ncbi:MAG: hypothetical protein WA667_14555, partial [Candidatus Nitrosopolaris sp.]
MITLEIIISLWKAGFKLVPLNELSSGPTISWSEIYSKPDYWSDEKLRLQLNKFYNIATTFGKSHLRDKDGRELYLYCLDIDSEEVLNRVCALLEQWKLVTFVTKTQKGHHVYWFEHNDEQEPILTEYCKKGCEFEIKCGKALCTLPPSRHRDNPFFHYENVGQADKIMIANGLYGKLVNDLLKDCLRKKNVKSRKHVRTANSIDLDSISPKIDVTANCNVGVETSENIAKRIVLSSEQIEESVQHFLPYYSEGTRDKFAFGFSGFAYKEGIAEESASKILEDICIRTNDTEKISRLETLHRTYVNGLENGFDSITGRTKLKEVIAFVSGCDDSTSENVIENSLKIWHGNNGSTYASHHNNGESNNEKKQSDLAKELAAENPDNPAEYTIGIINKTVKCDNSLVRANLYAGLSTYTLDPMNLVIAAPTSEGKTYTVLQTLQYFPLKDVKYIGSMSPKVIIRQNSILVDADTLKPIIQDIRALKRQIEQEEDKERKSSLQAQLEELKDKSCLLIDLRKKIYVFLEPPHQDLWPIIKPIMSHDSFVMEHPYVESNTREGIHVKTIITLGFPTFIFCTAKDESKWEQWDEIVSRSMVMSPKMSPRKYREANVLNAQLLGIPSAIQESLIRSKREMDLAKKCVQYLKGQIESATVPLSSVSEKEFRYNNPVWIPYADILGQTLPASKGTEMRINKRLLSLLKIIALVKANLRFQVNFANQILTIASVEDLTEALYIMQNSTGLPPYKIRFFNEIFYPLYQKNLEEENEQEAAVVIQGQLLSTQNKITALYPGTLTANEICDYYNLQNPKSPINSDNLRKTYLNELVSVGWIESIDVRNGNTKKAYYPIVVPSETSSLDVKTRETNETKIFPQFFTFHKINVPKNFELWSKDWLIYQILGLWKCGIELGNAQYSIDNYNEALQFLDIESTLGH